MSEIKKPPNRSHVAMFSVCVTKLEQKQLDDLMQLYGENKRRIISRALNFLHEKEFNK